MAGRTIVRGNPVTFKITGAKELEEKLNSLPPKFARKAIRDSLRPAVEIWRQEMRALAHKATGWMADQIIIRVSAHGNDEGRATVTLSGKQNPSRHARHVPGAINEALWNEFGTRKMAARPFIRPAFESKADSVLEMLISKLKEALQVTFS